MEFSALKKSRTCHGWRVLHLSWYRMAFGKMSMRDLARLKSSFLSISFPIWGTCATLRYLGCLNIWIHIQTQSEHELLPSLERPGLKFKFFRQLLTTIIISYSLLRPVEMKDCTVHRAHLPRPPQRAPGVPPRSGAAAPGAAAAATRHGARPESRPRGTLHSIA